jgi:O-antigen ligase
MRGKKTKKQQLSKTPSQPYVDGVQETSAPRPAPFLESPAPAETGDNPAVRSWRGAAGWGVAVIAFLVPSLVTFNTNAFVVGNVIMGKEYLLRFAALFWLIYISVSLIYGFRLRPTRRAFPLIALAALYLAWIPFAKYANYTVPKSVVIVTSAIVFFAMASLDQRGKVLAARATVLGGFVSLILTAAMSLTPSDVLNVSMESKFSLSDTFGNQNFYGIFLLAMIPLAIFVIRSSWKRGHGTWAGVGAVFLAVALIQFVLTYSRGAYIGAIVAVIAWLMPFSIRKTLKFAAVCLIIVSMMGVSIFALKDKYDKYLYFYSRLVSAPRAIQQRMEIWNVGLNVFLANPLLGAGPGSLQVEALGKISYDLLKRTHGKKFVDAHNDILTVALETGVGAALYLLFIGTVLFDGFRRRDTLGKLAFAGFAGIFSISFSTSASVQACTLFYPLLLGAIISGKDDYLIVRKDAAIQSTTALGYAGAAVCLFLVWWTYADLKETLEYANFEKVAQAEGVTVDYLKPRLRAISDVYPKEPARYKYEAWISLKETDLPRYLEMSKELYERDPAEITASFSYGYALLLNKRPQEAEPLLLDSWKRTHDSNNLLPALLYVVYNELGDKRQTEYFMDTAHSSPEFVRPEVVLAKLRQMKIVNR